MLTKVVLPAPLLPIRLTCSPGSTSMDTWSAATSAPKCLCRPRAERSALIRLPCRFAPRIRAWDGPARSCACSLALAPSQPKRADAARQKADHDQKEDSQLHLPGIRKVGAGKRAHQFEQEGRDEHRQHAVVSGKNGNEHEFARSGPVAEIGFDMAQRHDRER